MSAIEEVLSAIDAGKLLDVATGDGEFVEMLVRHLRSYTSITGIDIDENLLSDAIRSLSNRNIRFRAADARRLPFADASFDTVTLSDALHHFQRPMEPLSEMMRVLSPGGTLVLHEMAADRLSPKQRVMAELHRIKAEVDTMLGIFHGPTLTRDQMRSLVKILPVSVTFEDEYVPSIEATEGDEIGARLEFIDLYLGLVSSNVEGYARLRRRARRAAEAAYRVGIAPPPQIVFAAKRQSD
ncbi:MAG TPA: class I SAM-dependent methyltransferase [Spirochaetia bacterium]|nr:class I SAM-dependent methyltransferase [Spirochaetia bacterium]